MNIVLATVGPAILATPPTIALVGKAIGKRQTRAQIETRLMRQRNSKEHADVMAALGKLTTDVGAHRKEFAQYRAEHSQVHALINEALERQ